MKENTVDSNIEKTGIRKKESLKSVIVAGILALLVIGSFFIVYYFENNVVFHSEKLLNGIKPLCYVYYTNSLKDQTSARVAYFPKLADEINSTGMKNVGPFMRSPAFGVWLFTHCPVYGNGTQIPTSWNDSMAMPNTQKPVPNDLAESVKQQQSLHNYFYPPQQWSVNAIFNKTGISNSNHYTMLEQYSSNFGMSVSEVTDQMFYDGVINEKKDCINPSFESNSTNLICKVGSEEFFLDKDKSFVTIVQPKSLFDQIYRYKIAQHA